MLSRRGRKRRAPIRFREAAPSTRSRRSATVITSDDVDIQPVEIASSTATSDIAPTVGPAYVDAKVTILQQQMQCMQQQMQSMRDTVATLASVSSAPTAATAIPSIPNTPNGATAFPLTSNTPAGSIAFPLTSHTPGPAGSTAFPLTSNTTAGATAFLPPLPDGGMHPGEIARASNMSSFSSVPLDSLVNSKLKAIIWAGHYIELDLLLGGVVDNPVLIVDIRSLAAVFRVDTRTGITSYLKHISVGGCFPSVHGYLH